MKKLILLLPVALILSSCITRIFTVSPAPKPVTTVVTTTPTTVVTTPTYTTVHTPAKPATTINVVAPYCNADYLNLQAVAAAFAQSNTVQEFEFLLNNSSIMLSNLDLNGDGYIDYLRVLETVSGYNHVFLIQAVLAYNVYQDVATIIADVPAYGTCYVQVIGAPYIYGPKYIIQPVFARTPLIYACLRAYGYNPWRSPYYWNHYPSPYTHPAPKPYSHYNACVTTYMTNHRYCNNVTVVNEYHINNYTTIIQNDSRSDYAKQNPTGAATTTYKGNTTVSTISSSDVKNNTSATTSSRADKTSTTTTTTTTSTSTSSRTPATSTGSSTSSRTPATSTSSSTSSRATATSTPGTTVSTRISSTGKTTTTTTTRAADGSTSKTVTSSRTTAPTRTSVSTSATPARTTTSSSSRTSGTTGTTTSSRTSGTTTPTNTTGSSRR